MIEPAEKGGVSIHGHYYDIKSATDSCYLSLFIVIDSIEGDFEFLKQKRASKKKKFMQ